MRIMAERRKLAAGNWKMNGTRASLAELTAVAAGAAGAAVPGSNVEMGGQDCHAAASGAHTGDISAEMIADAGGKLVIVGHSERGTDHGETDGAVPAQGQAAC